MLRLYLGNLGSGKSASVIREIVNDKSDRMYYTNIKTKGIKNAIQIKPSDVIQKVITSSKINKDGVVEEKFKFDLNKKYWMKQKKPLNLVWDEIHLTANARNSQSTVNKIFSRFISMGRRITGFDEKGYGHFIFIAQAERTIDVNIRELANEIRYHRMYWVMTCKICKFALRVNSDMEEIENCLSCGSWKLVRSSFRIRVFRFNNWMAYLKFREGWGGRYHFEKYEITDIEKYFKHYDTHQMEDLWDDYINS